MTDGIKIPRANLQYGIHVLMCIWYIYWQTCSPPESTCMSKHHNDKHHKGTIPTLQVAWQVPHKLDTGLDVPLVVKCVSHICIP